MIRKEKHLDNKRRKGSDKKEKSMKKMVNIIEKKQKVIQHQQKKKFIHRKVQVKLVIKKVFPYYQIKQEQEHMY